MPRKAVKKSKHEFRYADSLHRKIKAWAKKEGITNSELLAIVFKAYFGPLLPAPTKAKKGRE